MQQYLIQQDWSSYTDDQHQLWDTLYRRQAEILPGRVIEEFLYGLKQLAMAEQGIPDFNHLNAVLKPKTGWEIVAVPGLVPDEIFFQLMAERKFPSTTFIRTPEQIDYLQEPDIFHDIFGHVPLSIQPVFADYMQAYGQMGLAALGQNRLKHLARLYWYTVEFGLITTPQGLRTYGAGIVSSFTETKYCLENSQPKRLLFDLRRVMRTNYRIDDFQESYFVIPCLETLFTEISQDLEPIYEEITGLPEFAPNEVLESDICLKVA